MKTAIRTSFAKIGSTLLLLCCAAAGGCSDAAILQPTESRSPVGIDLAHFGGGSAAVFERLPVDRGQLADILPLGTIAGAEDALPSADAILVPRGWRDGDRREPVQVYSMSAGLVVARDNDGSVTLRVRDHVTVRYAKLVLRSEIQLGRIVVAGELLGDANASASLQGVAVRVLDEAVVLNGWISPARYGELRNSAFFAQYLADSVRGEAFALVRRAAPDLSGRIDYDRAGRAVGSWFDAPQSISGNQISSTLAQHALTLAYDAEHPGQIRVAIGRALFGSLGIQGVFAVAWDDTDPAMIDEAAGIVTYRLYPTNDGARIGAPIGTLVFTLDNSVMRVGFVRDSDNPHLTSTALTLSR